MKLSRRRGAAHRQDHDPTNFATFGAEPCYSMPMPTLQRRRVRHRSLSGGTRRRDDQDVGPTGSRTRDSATMRRGLEPRTGLALKNHLAPGKADRLARSYIGRLALQRVMAENGIAAFVHPENTVPTPKIQGPNVGDISLDGITPFFQIPRVVVPAGMNDVVYEPQYALNEAKTNYVSTHRAEHAEDDAAAPDADRDHVLCRPGRRADADQDRHGLRVGDAPSHTATAFGPVRQ